MGELAAGHALPAGGAGVWFVEDRLATLLDVQSAAPHLADARLFLAEWGYVFPADGNRARAHAISPLTLVQAVGPFEGWLDHAKGQATSWVPTARSGGSWAAHISRASGQRVRNRQPFGTSRGLGGSPASAKSSVTRRPPIIGTAASNDWV